MKTVSSLWPLWSFLLVLVCFAAMVRQLDIDSPLLTLQQMQFQPGSDATDNASPPLQNPVQLPHHWRKQQHHGYQGRYTKTLSLNVPPDRLWGIYIPSIGTNAAVTLNGTLIGSGGDLQSPPARHEFRPLYFSIANGTLTSGDNEIIIEVVSDSAAGGYLGPVFMGADEVLRPVYQRAYFYRVTLAQFVFVTTLVSLFYIAWLSLKTRDHDYRHFTLMLVGAALFHVSAVVHQTPLPGWFWDWVRMLGTGLLVAFVTTFVHRYYHLSRPRLEQLIYLWLASGAIILLLVPPHWQHQLGTNVWDVSSILLGVYAFITSFSHSLSNRSAEQLAITLSILVLLAAGVRDWAVYSNSPSGYYGTLMLYAVLYPLAVFAGILLQRFVHAVDESRSLNRELEHRVTQKEQQLSRYYDEIIASREEQALCNERERIMRDMHDGIGGQLIAATQSARQLQDHQLVDSLETALADLRLMIDSFEPVYDDLGTVLGLVRMRLERRLQNHGLAFEWAVEDVRAIDNFGPQKVLNTMRIVEEAVTNVIKHAAATTIRVAAFDDVCGAQAGVCILVDDDGCGLPARHTEGRGLGNMQHRANELGATLTLSAPPSGYGTRMRLWIPVSQRS